MRVLLVAYSVTGPKEQYSKFFEAIKECGEKWWHYLDSLWLIKTDKSANEVGEKLADTLEAKGQDNVLVIEVIGHAQGWLPPSAWSWINEHVPPKD